MESVNIFSHFNIFCNTTEFLVLFSKGYPNVGLGHLGQLYELFEYRGKERGKQQAFDDSMTYEGHSVDCF